MINIREKREPNNFFISNFSYNHLSVYLHSSTKLIFYIDL